MEPFSGGVVSEPGPRPFPKGLGLVKASQAYLLKPKCAATSPCSGGRVEETSLEEAGETLRETKRFRREGLAGTAATLLLPA